MRQDSATLDLVDTIYAAAAREVPLSAPLAAYCRMTADFGACLFFHDPILGLTEMGELYGIPERLLQQYNEDYGDENPLFQRGVSQLMAGRICTAEDIMTFEELARTNYYREIMAPVGCRFTLGALITGKAQRWASFTTARAEKSGPYKSSDIEIVALLRRHMARALHILEVFEATDFERRTFSAVLEQLPMVLLIVDDACQILHANQAAHRLLDDGAIIGEVNGRFSAGRTNSDRATFRAWWNQLVASELADGDRYDLNRGNRFRAIDVSRISITQSGISTQRTWLVTMHDSGLDFDDDDGARRYGLTPAECRVVRGLLHTGDAVKCAERLELSPNTVRHHLKSIFHKTGTGNQTSLIVEIAGLLS